MVRKIVEWTDAEHALSQVCRTVDKDDEQFFQVISDLKDTCRATRALGLAAPQIGSSLRIFVVNLSYFSVMSSSVKDDDMKVYINPFIAPLERTTTLLGAEGCMSIPGQSVEVPRWDQIRVEYLNEARISVCEYHSGLMSRVIQHELDHLDGKLTVDTLPAHKRQSLYAKVKRKGTSKVA